MTIDIRRYIKYCTTCQLSKNNKIPYPTEKYAIEVEVPFIHLKLDIIGPLLTIQQRKSVYHCFRRSFY